MKIGYARISTKAQQLDLQIGALKKAGCEKIYKDIISGALSNHPALDQLLHRMLKKGKILSTADLSAWKQFYGLAA